MISTPGQIDCLRESAGPACIDAACNQVETGNHRTARYTVCKRHTQKKPG